MGEEVQRWFWKMKTMTKKKKKGDEDTAIFAGALQNHHGQRAGEAASVVLRFHAGESVIPADSASPQPRPVHREEDCSSLSSLALSLSLSAALCARDVSVT